MGIPEDNLISAVNKAYKDASSLSNASQIGGKHYTKCAIQPWDYVIANNLDYFQGSIVKYITRWRDKGGIEDLEKAKHFLEKYISFIKNDITRDN